MNISERGNKGDISVAIYKIKRTIALLSPLIIMLVIFWLSNQDEHISKKLSDVVGQYVLNSDVVERAADSGKSISVMPLFAGLSIRKFAHIVLYAILGIFSTIAAEHLHRCKKIKISLPFFICFSYAAFDEMHQVFVPGRTAQTKDVFIDAIGFIPSILLTFMIIALLRRKVDRN